MLSLLPVGKKHRRIDSWAYARGEITWEQLCAQCLDNEGEEPIGAPTPTPANWGHKSRSASGDKKLNKVRRAIECGPKKGKCCQDRPRCTTCPTVVHRLKNQDALALDDQALRVALVNARKW